MNHFYRKNQIANFEKRKKLSCNDMNSLVSLFIDIDGYNRFTDEKVAKFKKVKFKFQIV